MAGSQNIHASIFVQNSEDNPIRAQLLGGEHILLHSLEFVGTVTEVAAAGTNHDPQSNRELAAHRGNQAGARSHASFEKVAAQVNGVRATPLSRASRHNGVG